MAFKNIIGKLGNMRKEVEWVLYPQKKDETHIVLIQSDKRIASVNILSGIAILSDGKGSNNFVGLHPSMGAKSVSVPPEFIKKLKELISTNEVGNGIETVLIKI